jgi:hypothetical protein
MIDLQSLLQLCLQAYLLSRLLPCTTTVTSSSTFVLPSSVMGHQVVLAQPRLQLLLLGAGYHRSWIAAGRSRACRFPF